MRPYQPLLPRPSPEPEDVNTFRTRPFHMIDTPGGNGNQYGDFDPNMNMDMNQWPAGMFRPSQGLDAPNAFNTTQALDTSQGMSEPRSFDAINGFSTSHDPQSFSAPHLDLNTSQAMNGSWGGFVPDNQQFQDPFAMPYDLNGRTFNLPMRTNSSEEHEVPSPMSGTPQRRHFSMNAIRSNLPANPSFDNNVRPSIEQDGRLQQHPNNTGFGQPEQLHRVSEENNNGSHQHFQSSQHNRVAIPQLNSQQPLPTQPASIAPSMGPLSSAVIVPARPKPGRKPLPQEDAQDRRRVQNRLAQRNFRDKRAQKVSELTVDNDRLRKEKEDAIKKYSNLLNDARQETKTLKRKYEAMEKDLEAANKRAQEAENKLHSHGSFKRFKDAGFPNPVLQATTTSAALPSITTNWRGPVSDYAANNSMMTPPEEGWPETDMSSFWTSRNPRRQSNANEDNGTQWLGSGMDVDSHEDDGCGFCTDESNCSCLQSKAAEAAKAISKPEIMPGGCDACQKDPQRAEACRALAAKTDRSPLPPSSEQRNDSMAAPPAPSASTGMVSCSKFIDRVNSQGFGQRVPSISELFGGIASHSIHSYPSSAGAAGYDVNEQEAAQVLQDMSRRPSKHMPSTPSS